MKRIVLVLGSAASLLLSTSAMAAPAKKGSEASCGCSDHKKDHAAHSKKATKGVCPECGMTDCTCDHKECASCEHCQAEKAEGKKGSCSCEHDHEKAATPETKDATK